MHMSSPFRDCMEQALDEAKRRGDTRLGTDHLLLGVLHDPRAIGLLGADLADARSAMDRLDVAALAAVGVDSDVTLTASGAAAGHVGRSVRSTCLRESVRDAKLRRVKTIGVDSVLRSLLGRPAPDPAQDLLAEMGIDADALRSTRRPRPSPLRTADIMWLQPSSAAIRRTPQPSALRRTIAATSSGALIASPCGHIVRRETPPFEPVIRTLRLRA